MNIDSSTVIDAVRRSAAIQTEANTKGGAFQAPTGLGAVVDGNSRAPEPLVHDLAIITVSTNEAQWIRPCLRTVFTHIGDVSADVVVVDNESTDGTAWEAFHLDEDNMRSVYCPVGFAHGFCVVSDVADVMYKQSNYYADATERGIAYNDPDVAIEWPLPVEELIPSQRDASAPLLRNIQAELPFIYSDAGADRLLRRT
jgi:hypothetical protein